MEQADTHAFCKNRVQSYQSSIEQVTQRLHSRIGHGWVGGRSFLPGRRATVQSHTAGAIGPRPNHGGQEKDTIETSFESGNEALREPEFFAFSFFQNPSPFNPHRCHRSSCWMSVAAAVEDRANWSSFWRMRSTILSFSSLALSIWAPSTNLQCPNASKDHATNII